MKSRRAHKGISRLEARRSGEASLARDQARVRALDLHLAGQYAEAISAYDLAINDGLVDADIYYNRGLARHSLGELESAIADYDTALALDSSRAEAWENRAVALQKLRRPLEALASYEQALKRTPPTAQLLTNQGVSHHNLNDPQAALACYARAETLDSSYAPLYTNRGNTLRLVGRFDEAIANFDRALQLQPVYAEAWGNRAATLHEAGRLAEAREAYDRGALLYPSHIETRWNRSLLNLLTGDFESGWAEYEVRWQRPSNEPDRHRSIPKWLGDGPIAGLRILVYPEQGLGDFVQFFRYVDQLIQAGAQVVLETPLPLLRLMHELTASRPDASLQVVAMGSELPVVDVRIPIMSLPLALRTRVHAVPAPIPYLIPPAERLAWWREQLGPPGLPRVGLAWSGSPTHRNDINRSMRVSDLCSVLDEPFEFHCLQQRIRESDLSWLVSRSKPIRHDADIEDFADTAALAMLMDVVISVDTSIAHVAGALGRPLFLLLPYAPDFRWMLGRADSPWYPTARLFRQSVPGNWAEVVGQLPQALTDFRRMSGGE